MADNTFYEHHSREQDDGIDWTDENLIIRGEKGYDLNKLFVLAKIES